MYYCSNCGAAVPAGAERCPNCHGLFGGTGQGSCAQQAERQKQYKDYQKADQIREKRRDQERRHERRLVGSQKRWERIAHRNAEALKALETFGLAVSEAKPRAPYGTETDWWIHDIAWLETPPYSRNPRMSAGPSIGLKELLVGPRSFTYPTKSVMRYIEKAIVRTERNWLNHDMRQAKEKLDSLL